MWSVGCLIYFMLVGDKPFISYNIAKRHSLIVRGDYNKNETKYQDLTEQAKDLIANLIKVNPKERFSVT